MAFVGRSDVKDPGAPRSFYHAGDAKPLDVYREPMPAIAGSPVPGAQFQSAVARSGRAIPHVAQQLIEKYLADLERIGLLSR